MTEILIGTPGDTSSRACIFPSLESSPLCSLEVRDAQVVELLKHGGLTLATEGDGTGHDPTELPQLHNDIPDLIEVEVREVLLQHLQRHLDTTGNAGCIRPRATEATHVLAPLVVPSKKSAECVHVLAVQSHMQHTTQVFTVVSEALLHPSLYVRHHFLFQVAAQRVKAAAECSCVLGSTPVLVDGQRCQNALLHLSQLFLDNETALVIKRLELQLFGQIPEKIPSAIALFLVHVQIMRPLLNDSLLRHQVLPQHLLVVLIQHLQLPQLRSEIHCQVGKVPSGDLSPWHR